MSVRIIVRTRRSVEAEEEFFRALGPAQRSRWMPMLCSLAVHGVMLLLVPYLAGLASQIDYQRSDWQAFRAEQMRLRVPERIYYRAEGSRARQVPAPNAAPAQSARKQLAAAPGGAQRHPRRAGVPIPEGMEIPSTPQSTIEAPVILQPDAQSNELRRLANAVPLLAFWARQAPNLPKPPRKQLIVPGRTESPAPPPQMAAPPVIAIPNREVSFSDLNIALPPGPTSAALPVPNSTTAPVRDRQTDARSGAANSIEGQAANIIVLSTNRTRPDEVVTIPRGLQNAPPPGSGSGTETPAEKAPLRNGGAAPAQGQEARAASQPSEAAVSASATTGGRGTADGSHRPEAASAPKPGEQAATVSGGSPASGSAVTIPSAPSQAVTRITHPANGSFDVVIMQSGARDDLPDVRSLLTGSPVYTVYLQVGDRKEWLLEFCAPPGEISRSNPYQVYVEDAPPLSPPYAISTVIPNSIIGRRRPKTTILHGYLTSEGHFRNLEGRDAGDPLVRELVPLLDQWQFRPASRNKTPTEVEIVLVVAAVSE